MNIAVLGTGKVGSALGARLASSGHHVVYGSRNPSGAPGILSRREAVASADVVITAIPGTAVLSALERSVRTSWSTRSCWTHRPR